MTVVKQTVVSLFVGACLLAVYHFGVIQRTYPEVHTVDLVAIVQAINDKQASKLMDDKLSPSERQKIVAEADEVGQRLEAAIKEVADTCNCVIVVRQAVINQNAPDWTTVVKSRLGV